MILSNFVGVKRKWYVNYTRQNFFTTSLLPFQSLFSNNNNILRVKRLYKFVHIQTFFDRMVTVDGDLLRSSVMLYINHDRITTKDCLSFHIDRKNYAGISVYTWEINLGSNFPSIRHIKIIINRRHRF